MKATRTDVAKLAKVSTATVSNVLNKTAKVNKETISRVLKAVEQLNYRPDMIARSLITGQTRQIGIVLENIRNPHYGEIVEHFESAAESRGYFVNICTGISKLDNYFDNFVARGLDGAFVAALPYKFELNKINVLIENDIKVVVSTDIDIHSHKVSVIKNDYIKAMEQAISYLVSLGHREIALLSGLSRELTYDERCKGYLQYIEEMRLPYGDSLLFDGKYPFYTNTQEGYKLANRLIDSGKLFTAAICGNDLIALGAIKAFHDKGLSVPEDVSVIGFDGIELGHFYTPPLTTLAVNCREFGENAFELLYNDMINEIPGKYLNELTLSVGESTARRKGS